MTDFAHPVIVLGPPPHPGPRWAEGQGGEDDGTTPHARGPPGRLHHDEGRRGTTPARAGTTGRDLRLYVAASPFLFASCDTGISLLKSQIRTPCAHKAHATQPPGIVVSISAEAGLFLSFAPLRRSSFVHQARVPGAARPGRCARGKYCTREVLCETSRANRSLNAPAGPRASSSESSRMGPSGRARTPPRSEPRLGPCGTVGKCVCVWGERAVDAVEAHALARPDRIWGGADADVASSAPVSRTSVAGARKARAATATSVTSAAATPCRRQAEPHVRLGAGARSRRTRR